MKLMRNIMVCILLLGMCGCSNDKYAEAKKYLNSEESALMFGKKEGQEIVYEPYRWERINDSEYSLVYTNDEYIKEYTIDFDSEMIQMRLDYINDYAIDYIYDWHNDRLIYNKEEDNQFCKVVMDRLKRAYINDECDCSMYDHVYYETTLVPHEWYQVYQVVVEPFENTPMDFN